MALLKLVVIGNAGSVPDIRTTAAGTKQATVSIAVNARSKDRATHQMVETTDWWRAIFFDKLAGIAEQFIQKGSQIYVEGRPRLRKWTDENNQTRIEQEVVVDRLQLLGGRPQEAVRASAQAIDKAVATKPAAAAEYDDDIPY